MDSQPFNLMCFVQNLATFLTSEDIGKSPRDVIDYASSTNFPVDYKTRSHNRLLEITDNISKTIIESCSGIDEICNKVRECLEDAHTMGIHVPQFTSSLPPISEQIQ